MWDAPLPDTATNKKLIILDPSLKDLGGHFYEYDAALGAAASRRAIHTLIYANKSCPAGLPVPGGEIHPWFSTAWSASGGRSKSTVRFILSKLPITLRIPLARFGRLVWALTKKTAPRPPNANAAISTVAEKFGKEVIAALRHAGCNRDDIVFLPTIRTSELFALWKAVQSTAELKSLQFHIVLRRDVAEMDLPEDGAPGISFLFRELHAAPARKAFIFYCDTQQLCNDYALLSSHRQEFRLLPIPYPMRGCRADQSRNMVAPARRSKLVYLGGARVEKGFHLLSLAENSLRKTYAGEILWRLQAPISGGLEEPEVISARRDLSSVRDGSVELVERNLSSAEFQSLLLSADIVLLPYLPEFYRARSSGILVQVLAAGKPVVVPADTWLSRQTNGIGAVEFDRTFRFSACHSCRPCTASQTVPRGRKNGRRHMRPRTVPMHCCGHWSKLHAPARIHNRRRNGRRKRHRRKCGRADLPPRSKQFISHQWPSRPRIGLALVGIKRRRILKMGLELNQSVDDAPTERWQGRLLTALLKIIVASRAVIGLAWLTSLVLGAWPVTLGGPSVTRSKRY